MNYTKQTTIIIIIYKSKVQDNKMQKYKQNIKLQKYPKHRMLNNKNTKIQKTKNYNNDFIKCKTSTRTVKTKANTNL